MPFAAIQRFASVAPKVSAASVFSAVSVLGFGGLLLQDQVPALLIYCLQIFLAA